MARKKVFIEELWRLTDQLLALNSFRVGISHSRVARKLVSQFYLKFIISEWIASVFTAMVKYYQPGASNSWPLKYLHDCAWGTALCQILVSSCQNLSDQVKLKKRTDNSSRVWETIFGYWYNVTFLKKTFKIPIVVTQSLFYTVVNNLDWKGIAKSKQITESNTSNRNIRVISSTSRVFGSLRWGNLNAVWA